MAVGSNEKLRAISPRDQRCSMGTWDPRQYQRFQKERAQPFFDLLNRVPDGEVATVADLGCGPGTLTVTLTQRWEHATIWGVDNSPQMLAEAATLPSQTNQDLFQIQLLLAVWLSRE